MFQQHVAVQEHDERMAASVGEVASSRNGSLAAGVSEKRAPTLPRSPPDLGYLQSENGEADLVEISYRNQRITFPANMREEAYQPDGKFREDFEHFQSSLPAIEDAATKRNGTPAIFYHIHKYGGTSMCLLARLNGETVPPGDCNCNFCQDTCTYSRAARMQPSDYGFDMIPHASVSYAQIERDLSPEDLDKFLSMKVKTGVMLRDPMEGVLANIVAHKIALSDLESALMAGDFRRAYAHEPGCLRKARDPPSAIGHLIQSFATRSLSGFFDVSSTSDEHLETAKRNLDKFDVVELLEDLNMPRFEERFGWNADISLAKKNSVGAYAKNGLKDKLVAYGLWDRLSEVNAHDTALYEYARDKYR
jgi:hypothetical protein